MHYPDFFIVLIAALFAGALNFSIGGGWFVMFPGLIAAGLQPLKGNTTTAAALFSGYIATLKITTETKSVRHNNYNWILAISIVGGMLGSLLLIVLKHEIFEFIGPYLLLFSWFMFTFSDRILRYSTRAMTNLEHISYSHSKLIPFFLISIYGSYFGAGLGLIITAMLRFCGLADPAEIEKVKNRFVIANNGTAIAIFIFSGILSWPHVAISAIGVVSGGYLSHTLLSKSNDIRNKKIIVIAGALVTLYFLTCSFLSY